MDIKLLIWLDVSIYNLLSYIFVSILKYFAFAYHLPIELVSVLNLLDQFHD